MQASRPSSRVDRGVERDRRGTRCGVERLSTKSHYFIIAKCHALWRAGSDSTSASLRFLIPRNKVGTGKAMAKDTMKAVVFKEPHVVAIEDRPIPKIREPTDVIVKVIYTALCGR